jgi:integrase
MLNKLNAGKVEGLARGAPPASDKKHADGGGLYLLHRRSGALLWNLKYRIAGAEKRLSLGMYPAVGLAEARVARDAAKAKLAAGIDPGAAKQEAKAALAAPKPILPTFGLFAGQLLTDIGPGQHPATKRKWVRHVGYATAHFGARDIGTIKANEILEFLRPIAARGNVDTAKSVKQKMSAVFRRGMLAEACAGDPTVALKDLLPRTRSRPQRAIIQPEAFGAMLRKIDTHTCWPQTRAAMLMLALTFQRPHMIRFAEWSEIDWANRRWDVPARAMKGQIQHKKDHIVPLSEPALQVLRSLEPITGHGKLIFPGLSGDKPLSDGTMNKALRDLGVCDHVGHGFRASANTMIKEHLADRLAPHMPIGAGVDLQELIDLQLAHVLGNAQRQSYDRVKFLKFRVVLMDVWGDFINELRQRPAKVTKLRSASKEAR